MILRRQLDRALISLFFLEIRRQKCHCFRQREIDLLYAQSNIREVLERENFSHFSYEYFDDTKIDPRSGKTARAYMEQVTAFCHRYVDGFKEEKGNILFTGKTGLGKTFLSNCIAKELIERCFWHRSSWG